MRAYSFTAVEYEPGRPWIIRSTHRGRVELDDGESFDAWAKHEWPSDRFMIKLDPAPLGPWPSR
jgi:hypothetical protein